MEKSDAGEASYKACAECTGNCQITHGKGMARFARFSRPVPVYALPSAQDCNMQIPAPYVRQHMPNLDKTQKFTLVGVTGSEWVVAFTRNALRAGWKVFATDHRLEKGDMIMFTLIALNRFSVCVFDSSGEEKFGTFSNSRDSLSTVINTTLPLGPRNETPVSNYTSGADGAPPCTPNPTHTLKPYDDICSPSSAKTSGDDETLMSLSRKRALKEKDHLPHEPRENYEAEHSSSSESEYDSVSVRLAKEILLKSEQKKLKKRKLSGALAVRIKGTLGTEDPGDKISKGVAILSSSIDPGGSPKGDVDEIMFEKHAEDPRVGVSNGDKVTPHVGDEPQSLSNAVPNQPEEVVGQTTPPSDPRQNEALVETETARGATEEDAVLKGSETRQVGELLPSPVFQPRLVKQEADPTVAKPHPHQACTNCKNCGLPKVEKTPTHLRLKDFKSEPVTSENPETPEARNPSSNAPSTSTGRVTEYQKQQALKAAKDYSALAKARHATVVMTSSTFNVTTYVCFVSLQCAEMLPQNAALVSLNCKGVSCEVNWNAAQRRFEGSRWKAWFDEHKLQMNDVLFLELVKNSEQECVVRVDIFYAHEMEDVPVRPAPAYTGIDPPGPKMRSSNLLHGCSQPSTSAKPKSVARRYRGIPELPEVSPKRIMRTPSSSPSTPRFATAPIPTARPSSMYQRKKPSAPAVVSSEPPRPPPAASTADAARRHSISPRFATAPIPTAIPSPMYQRKKPSAPAVVSSEPPRPPPAASTADAARGIQIRRSIAEPKSKVMSGLQSVAWGLSEKRES